ncbi:MAG: pyruvate, phosphate dikinase [Gemmatimonadetes bacterium]|nr:pyruvate, phosphate dikinase [Gemmatimonadota bacterium]
MASRFVYYFGNGVADGGKEDKELLGGKGSNLAEMVRIGLPVPPGFTISPEVCRLYLTEKRYPEGLKEQVKAALERLEGDMGKQFGSGDFPLLVSVRSGAAASMPGMMETILNLGLNDQTVEALAKATDNERFAFDSYRRIIQMYCDEVLGINAKEFEKQLSEAKEKQGVKLDMELSAASLREVVKNYKALVEERLGQPFPAEPEVQLWGAIEAVFRSWNADRAVAYRKVEGLPDTMGTAVNVQVMVYGNMGEDSGTGVAFTRNPATGENAFFGEFLLNAQGEDVVAGIRTPHKIAEMDRLLPAQYQELVQLQHKLEQHYAEMQDLEFTVERGKLYMLQTRRGKRTAAAAVKVAVDMANEGLIDKAEAVKRVSPDQLDQLLHPRLDPKAKPEVVVTGLPASPGAASGQACFDPDLAAERAANGEKVILIREETSPDDFHGMVAAKGLVTARGGMTSHAAVVARGMGKCCVVGATGLHIDEETHSARGPGGEIKDRDWVTVDGTTGRILQGKVPTVDPEMTGDFKTLMEWADSYRDLKVRANADTPTDAKNARMLGAQGIGLCRTEHMFFEGERIQAVREMILAGNVEERRAALAKLLPMQRGDFEGIFREMAGLPVTIRTLDPPLHEFLPNKKEDQEEFAKKVGLSTQAVARLVEKHREANPMLGHRGCRLGLTYPEITEMQARAIFEAAVNVSKEGIDVLPEVMIPLVGDIKELEQQREIVLRVAEEVQQASGIKLHYLIGTMIALPRAALLAAEIAGAAEFFSFGANDLAQATYGISRDDAVTFLPHYIEAGIYKHDPFQVLDRSGVGQLVAMATANGRKTRTNLKVGVCGEHGGEPSSVEFFHDTGLDYVSCSPFRVPVARLAAAHAALARPRKGKTQA